MINQIWFEQIKNLANINCKNDLRVSTKPIFNTSINILKNIDKLSIHKTKEILTKAITSTNNLILNSQFENSIYDEDCASDEIDSLPLVSYPYLPPLLDNSTITLVLDLDETLVHYIEDINNPILLFRPGVQHFLEEMSKLFEIVIFTAAMQDYADWVIDQLDIKSCVSYRLYRQHLTSHNGSLIKDISKLGRELSKTIIVDNIADNFQKQPENGILIKSWYNDPYDDALIELAALLKVIAKAKMIRQLSV